MKRFFLFALVATALAACSTDTTQDLAPEIPTAPDELQVSFDEEDTRIQLGEDGAPVWTEGDLISVFYRSNANSKYQFVGETGDADGSIELVEEGVATQQTTQIVAVYPYSEDYWFNWNTGDVEAFLPAEQTYLKDSFGIGSSIMVSKSDYKQLSFKNVCGWIKLQFTGTGYVSKIVLKGNDGEQVAGEIYINTQNATCALASDMGESGEDSMGGNIITDNTILTSVTLNCGDDVALNSETPTVFYVALPPQTFENGFTATMYGCDGSTKEISTNKTITIERNHILPMASATLEMPITNNVIWYTSSDGNVIEPYSGNLNSNATAMQLFGANITSNTYENGVGVITFDGDVTSIGEGAFYNRRALTSITIPDSVTTIGYRAFYNCDALKSVTIGDSVTTIEQGAFEDCSALTSITIPDSVTTIGDGAFCGCSALTSVTIPNSVTTIGGRAFDSCSALTSVAIPNSVTTIGGSTFYSCRALTSVTIPDSVTTIGSAAFEGCDALTSVTIPDSVTTIGDHAFSGCDALTSVTIPDSVTTIGFRAFYNCDALKAVYCKPTTPPIADKGSSSYWNAFDNNASDRKIYVPTASVDAYKAADGWKEYADAIVAMPIPSNEIWYTSSDGNVVTPYSGDYNSNATAMQTFGANITSNTYENGVGVITFDGDVTKIESCAFYDCNALISVTIPNSVTTIGNNAFIYCDALTSVIIGNSVKTIGEGAFYNCDALASITIPDSVMTIGDFAFWGCYKLTSVTIGNNVTTIGISAFADCSKLKSVTIPDSVTTIGSKAFASCCYALTSVTIPDSVTTIGEGAFGGCDALKAFYGKFASADNRCLIVDGVLNSFAPAGLTEYTIPNSVTTIGDSAFRYCSALTSVTIPNSVTMIVISAFRDCDALTSVTIPDSVTTIGSYAFYNCDALKEVYCKPTTPPSLGNSSVFDNNSSDRKIYVPTASVDAYKAASRWSEYADAIVAMPIPSNQIWYTSSDGNVVEPYSGKYNSIATAMQTFGANIVSNTYKNGVGVITFDGDVTTIGSYAFYNRDTPTSVTIPNSVTVIGKGAFQDCDALTSVTIPDGVTVIEEDVFYSCDALKTVYCKPTTPPSLNGVYVFDFNASDRKIYVPTASVDAYKAKQNWIEYADAIEPYNFAE